MENLLTKSPVLTVPPGAAPLHLKNFLKTWDISGTYWKKLKTAGLLTVNGIPVTRDVLLGPGDKVQWIFLPETCTLLPEEAPIEILYEDEFLLCVNKPAGLITHNSTRERTPALSRRVAYYYQRKNFSCGMHPVSRLDKETSGAVLFAKNAWVHHFFTRENLEKIYLGITLGHWNQKESLLDFPIARAPGSIVKRQIDPDGLFARTRCKVLAENKNLSLVEFLLETGRTHQIRVHCAAAGHPLLGDHLYGEPGPQSRHYLHAWKLSFSRPFTKEKIMVTAPVPGDFQLYFPVPQNS